MKDTFLIQDGQILVFMGDSITSDAKGYAALVEEIARLRYPERNMKFINAGIGGNRSTDMLARFETDVLRHKPKLVSITSGANDIARFITDPPTALGLPDYSQAISSMAEKTISAHAFPILVSPPPFEAHWHVEGGAAEVNKRMEKYVKWMREYAEENRLVYVPFFEEFLEVSKKTGKRAPDFRLTEDGVHLNFRGSMLAAITFLRSIGFGWRI